MQRFWRVFKLTVFALFVLGVLLVGILPIGGAYLYINQMVNRTCGNRPEPLTERLTHPENLEAFTFSPDGEDFVLDGWYAAGTNGVGIIVLPGAWGGSNTMYQEMDFLHEAGYSVMTYDTRSCAEPPQTSSLGYIEIADLQAAIDIMSQRPDVDPNRIGVLGHSMGGATAIMTAARDERIKAVVATGNYGDLANDVRRDIGGLLSKWVRFWIEQFYERETGVDIEEVSPLNNIAAISPRPVFLIHGSRELDQSGGLSQFEAAGDPKELWIVEGAGHGEYPSIDFPAYTSRTIAFFDMALNPHDN